MLAVAVGSTGCVDVQPPPDGTNGDVMAAAPSDSSVPDDVLPAPDGSSGAWTSRTVVHQGSNERTRRCVELTNRGSTEDTCLFLPGVSSWIVGGDHFVLASGSEIALDDGASIRPDRDGISLGLIGRSGIAEDATGQRQCDRRELAVAMLNRLGPTSEAWLPVACANGQFALVEFGEPAGNIGLLARNSAWVVLGLIPPGVGCGSLEGTMQDACRALSLDGSRAMGGTGYADPESLGPNQLQPLREREPPWPAPRCRPNRPQTAAADRLERIRRMAVK